MTEEASQAIGKVVLGRYRIVRRLAKGGMGVVYLARIEGAEGFVRPAVIKRMLPEYTEQDEHVRMFVREARILADLRHPGVVSVLDFAAEADAYLMALDYVDGFSLNQWLRYLRRQQRAFDPTIAIYMIARVLDALHYVHTRKDEDGEPLGIVHRDVSPSNILVDREGRVRILDFGIARTAREVTRTNEGEISIKGKLAYLAPELLQGEAPSVASDVYACGVTLHELVSGGNEYRDKDPTETMRRVLLNRLTELEPLLPRIPKGFDSVVRRATTPAPENRFEDAAAMAQALDALLDGDVRELEGRLARTAGHDFQVLPQVLGIPALSELDRAWREAPGADMIPTDPPPGVAAATPEELAGGGRSGGLAWAVAGLAVLAIAGLGLGGYAVWQSQRPEAQTQMVVVDQRSLEDPDPTPDDPPDAPATSEERADAGSAGAEEPARPPDRPSGRRGRGGADPAMALSRRFNARHGELRACFREHASSSEGRPQLSVRFSVSAAGEVTSAQLFPASVAATPLGRCLLTVARSTSFGPQSGAISFRIPITVTGG